MPLPQAKRGLPKTLAVNAARAPPAYFPDTSRALFEDTFRRHLPWTPPAHSCALSAHFSKTPAEDTSVNAARTLPAHFPRAFRALFGHTSRRRLPKTTTTVTGQPITPLWSLLGITCDLLAEVQPFLSPQVSTERWARRPLIRLFGYRHLTGLSRNTG